MKDKIENIIFEELLLENSLNRAKETWERAIKKVKEKFPETSEQTISQYFDPETFDIIIEGDPSHTKKYSAWIINQYNRAIWAGYTAGVHRYVEAVQKYDELIKLKLIKGSESNIYSVASKSDLDEIIDAAEEKRKEVKIQKAREFLQNQVYTDARPSEPVVIGNDKYFIARPRNFDESVRYAKGANWCVADKSDNAKYWNDYISDRNYTLYYIQITDEKTLEALGTVFEDRVDSTPESLQSVIVGYNDGDYDVKDKYDNNLEDEVFDEYIALLKIPNYTFKNSNDVDRSGGELDEDEQQEREDSAYNSHIDEVRELIKNYSDDFAKHDTNTFKIPIYVLMYFDENYPEWTEISYDWNEGYGRDSYPTAYSRIENDMNSVKYNDDNDDLEDSIISRIQEAMYYAHTLDPDLAVEFEQKHPEMKKRPYVDASKFTQQELFEAIYRRTLKLLQERKVLLSRK